MLHLHHLIDDAKCYETVRRLRWPCSVRYPHGESNKIAKRGRNHRHQECRRYRCKKCGKQFDDLTGTIFAGHHQPLGMWITGLYLRGLNVSNQQIAHELDLNDSDVQEMTSLLPRGIVARRPVVRLEGEVECDEVYVIAGADANAGCRGTAYYPTSGQCLAKGKDQRFPIGQPGRYGPPTGNARFDHCGRRLGRASTPLRYLRSNRMNRAYRDFFAPWSPALL